MRAPVGVIGPFPPPFAGMANQAAQLCRLLREDGFGVETVATNLTLRPAFLNRIPRLRALLRLLVYVIRVWRLCGRVGVVHMLANSGWSWHLFAAPVIWIAWLRRTPLVINYRGGGAETFLGRSIRWVRPSLNRVRVLTVPSGYLQAVFGRFGVTAEVVPNVIDTRRFHPPAESAAVAGSGRPPLTLVVTRNLEPIYDCATPIRALPEILRQVPGARLCIAGTGPERQRLQTLVEALGLADNVQFLGRLDGEAVAQLLREADISINPSLVDNMPNSVLEALASGVPVVSTDVGGVRFVVEHERTALLVPPGDSAAMAQACLRLAGDERLRRSLVEQGLASIQDYTWASVRRRLLATYARAGAGEYCVEDARPT